jgi:hypothetical protein
MLDRKLSKHIIEICGQAHLFQDADKAGDEILVGLGVPLNGLLQRTKRSTHDRWILQTA